MFSYRIKKEKTINLNIVWNVEISQANKKQQQQKSLTEYKKEKQENKTVEMNHNTYGLLFC